MYKKLKIGLDFDDVLAPCISHAIDIARKKGDGDFVFEDITEWNLSGTKYECFYKYFAEASFYETQTIYPDAVDFVAKLSEIAEVFIFSAICPAFMSIRAAQILNNFGNYIDEDHIMLGKRKDLLSMDILYDDSPSNILSTQAAYPVICRKPWNKGLTGLLAANSYDEFFNIVKELIAPEKPDSNLPVLALIGPSGSGKTTIIEELAKDERFVKVVSTTSRSRRPNEPEDAYHFVSKEEFEASLKAGQLFEHTMYANNLYGTKFSDFEKPLSMGQIPMIAIDMAGALKLKMHYKAILCFVDRAKESLVRSIVDRDVSTDDKVRRIVSLDIERANKALCDAVVDNNKSVSDSASQIHTIMQKWLR